MTDESPLLKSLKKEYSRATLTRSTWQDHWQQLRRWCRPNSPDFSSSTTSPLKGDRRNDEIYDSTAPWALEQFASGLSSVLTDMSTRWFGIAVQGVPMKELSREENQFLEDVSERIYFEFALPDSNTYTTLNENYLEIGAFGTCCQYQYWDFNDRMTKFRACPLADCFFIENAQGVIDKVFYRRTFTTRQLLDEWPHLEQEFSDDPGKFKEERDWEIVHAVFPREERNIDSFLAKNKKFAAFYFSPDLPVVIEESGFDYFPYNTARWTKIAGETYGRSPGMNVLPDIRTVNQMQKELLVSAQLANFPPIVAEDESLLTPLADTKGSNLTLTPKSIIWKEQGAEFPQALNSGMQPQLTLEMLEGLRESITRAFFVNHLIRAKKKERQTTTEILDERGEMMRQLQPQFGRINSELLDNMIKTSYFLLDNANELPEPPSSLAGRKLEIVYFSPAAKAQLGTKAQNISGFLQDITPLINVEPAITQEIEWSEIMSEYAIARDIPVKVIKSPEQRESEKAAAQEQAAQQQQMEAAPAMAGAVKDIADAREKDPNLIPELSGLL